MISQAQPYVGGQALIEGVMMRSPERVTVAVRRPDGTVAMRHWQLLQKSARSKVWKWPLLRGVAVLGESLSMGFKALMFSAEEQMTEEDKKQVKTVGRGAMVVSTVLALGLFVALPQFLTLLYGQWTGTTLAVQDPQFHWMTGGFKLIVLLLYLTFISRIPDVRRVFQYHGAEHKTIYAYEKGLELTVENARIQSTLHPRCGTTFLVVVVVVSILVGSLVTPLLLPNVSGASGQVLTLLLRVALLPLIAAISYELQRLSARFCTTGPLQAFLWPGYLVQKITTREPDDAQLEIAVLSMRAALVPAAIALPEERHVFASVAEGLDHIAQLNHSTAPVAQAA